MLVVYIYIYILVLTLKGLQYISTVWTEVKVGF